MKIGGLEKTTLIDYPGKVAATVFLVGCNFRCPFCYSPEIVLPEKIKKHLLIPERDSFQFLKERKEYLEGIVVCGGEPTIQKNLEPFLKKIKRLGYAVKLDTNGSQPQVIKKLIQKKLVDYIAMDVKAPFIPQKYYLATGVTLDLKDIIESVNIIKDSGIDYEFRTTVVPTIHSLDDIVEIARALAPAKRYYLQNFRAEKTLDERFLKIKPYSGQELENIVQKIKHFFEDCRLR